MKGCNNQMFSSFDGSIGRQGSLQWQHHSLLYLFTKAVVLLVVKIITSEWKKLGLSL